MFWVKSRSASEVNPFVLGSLVSTCHKIILRIRKSNTLRAKLKMDPAVFIWVIVLYIIYRFFHLRESPSVPKLVYKRSKFNQLILDHCPSLLERYVPTWLWGRSGHLQTFVYVLLGRLQTPSPEGERKAIIMSDGATNTFDIFPPTGHDDYGAEDAPTLAVCPGLGNNSETTYICALVHYLQNRGWRVVVLNHLGALNDVPLTSPRIFNFGATLELQAMVEFIKRTYPDSPLVLAGFSMGANLVIKYLGEHADNQRGVVAALSFCQGYDVIRAEPLLHSWHHLRRGYLYLMCEGHKRTLRKNGYAIFTPEAKKKIPGFDEKALWKSTSLLHLDAHYTCKHAGFSDVRDFYHWCSSGNYIHKVHVPLLIVNAKDDPIVPPDLHDIPSKFVAERDNAIFCVTSHGGHLGFFEGGVVRPRAVTWLDKVVLQYASAAVKAHTGAQPSAS